MRKIINLITSLFSRKAVKNGLPAYVYVFFPGKEGANSEVNPNDQIAILRRLSSFSSKKNSPVTIIFPGRPSRKIPDGAKQDGVQARYATSDQLDKVVRQSIEEFQKTHSVVLAADRSEFQKLADKLRINYCLASTFTKTLDSVCGTIQREAKAQTPRRQPQSPKNAQKKDEGTPSATKPSDSVAVEATNESPAPEQRELTPDSIPSSEPPSPKKANDSRPKLHRHVPSQKRELTDRAILDLIDPL